MNDALTEAVESAEPSTILRDGKPVAVIVPWNRYLEMKDAVG